MGIKRVFGFVPKPVVFGILFYITFQLFLTERELFLWFILAFLIVSIMGVYKVSEKRGFLMILPLLFAFGSLVLFSLVTGKISEQAYIALAAIGFFMTLVQTSKKIRKIDNELWYKINTSLVFVTMFLWSAGLYGLYLKTTNLPFWPLALISLFIFGILYYYAIKVNELRINLTIFVLLFIIINLEIIWSLSFTHFAHLTIGATLLVINYVLWDILENYCKKTLTKKLLFTDLVFFVVIMSGLLLTTKWLPG